MIESISRTQKADILLALALAFEKKLNETESEKEENSALHLTKNFLTGFSGDNLEALRTRAEYYDRLPPEKRRLWQKNRLDIIRRRGIVERLDPNIHPAQIAEVLNREPKNIQLLVLKNLSVLLSRRVIENLDAKLLEAEIAAERSNQNVSIGDEIVTLVRNTFVDNFITFEDVFDASATDKIAIEKFEDFVRHLGIRETAIACRGINSKETLAAFLNRFDEESAREIAENMAQLENVKPFWVERADRFLRQTLADQFQPETLLQSLGYNILAIAFVRRDRTARRYTAQKMMPFEAKSWLELIAESEREFTDAPEKEREIFDRRRRIVERVAADFI